MAGPEGTGKAMERRASQTLLKGSNAKRAHTQDSEDEDDPDFET